VTALKSSFTAEVVSGTVAALTDSNQCAAVIPCFNEGRTIDGLVRHVLQHVGKVIVVDDGSTDSTPEMAGSAGAQVLSMASNSGKGAALVHGLRAAADLGFDYAVTMDGDGQHDPDDLPGFLDIAESNGADLVVGNRMTNTAAMPWVRRIVNRWMSGRISRLAGVELPDTQCGYRLIRLSVWRELTFSSTGFEIESEMLFAFVQANRRIRFIPVQTVYKSEQSKIHPVRDTIRWLRWWQQAKR